MPSCNTYHPTWVSLTFALHGCSSKAQLLLLTLEEGYLLTAITSDVERGVALLSSPEPMLDDILKSRDVTLPTNVHLVKVMVFPVVMYGCESWTIKKAEHQRLMLLNCDVGEDS